jgi:hypothetical protein
LASGGVSVQAAISKAMPMIAPAQERTIIIGRLGLGKGTLASA